MSNTSIEKQILKIIRGHGSGWVFTPRDLTTLGDPRSVGMALTRLVRKGKIRRLARGLYDYPRQHPTLGSLAPSPDVIAKAITGRYAIRLQPSGAYAANLLGLSDQIPMRIVFLTDGPSRRIQVGKQQIILKHTTPQNMMTAGTVSGLIIQALRHTGKQYVDDSMVTLLNRNLNKKEKMQLLKDLRHAPAWIARIMRQVAESAED